MRHCFLLSRIVLAACFIAVGAFNTDAQTGRIGGIVKDDTGQALKGATVLAENPSASPNSFTATTDDKGRFSIIGLRTGTWTFTAQAPGFGRESGQLTVQTLGAPNPPLTFTLKKNGPMPVSALGSLTAKDLQADLASADALFNGQRWDESIAAYRAIQAKTPALTVIELQIAMAYRNKKDYDDAIGLYQALLKAEPNNEKARIGLAMTNVEKGDIKAAEETLTTAAQGSATREVFYSLGEVKFAKGEPDEAARWYQKASDTDPTWGKPIFKLGLVAVNKGDKAAAATLMEKVIATDPTSPEATQARTVIDQMKK